jgi:hypothetical protein
MGRGKTALLPVFQGLAPGRPVKKNKEVVKASKVFQDRLFRGRCVFVLLLSKKRFSAFRVIEGTYL